VSWDASRVPAGRRSIDEARILELMLVHGWSLEVAAGKRDSALAQAQAALDRFVHLGLPHCQDQHGTRLFDPVEILHFARWAFYTRGEPIFAERFVATGRALIWEPYGAGLPRERPPGQPPPHGAVDASRFRFMLTRKFNLAGHPPGTKLRLRLPAPLPDGAIQDLSTQAIVDPKTCRAVLSPGRLDVRAERPESLSISIGIECSFRQTAAPPCLDSGDLAIYTKHNEGLVKITEPIQALAARLAGDAAAPATVIRRLFNHLYATLSISAVHYDQLDPGAPLDAAAVGGWCDCRVASALLVALCRCRDIPARIVSGYKLHPGNPSQHSWVEVWLAERGWIGLDLTDLSFNGRDTAWRDYFFGQLTQRIAVERLPRLFSGPGPSVRWPKSWHMLTRRDGDGVLVEYSTVESDALIYSDHLVVERLGQC
jgi:hypothetical protein